MSTIPDSLRDTAVPAEEFVSTLVSMAPGDTAHISFSPIDHISAESGFPDFFSLMFSPDGSFFMGVRRARDHGNPEGLNKIVFEVPPARGLVAARMVIEGALLPDGSADSHFGSALNAQGVPQRLVLRVCAGGLRERISRERALAHGARVVSPRLLLPRVQLLED